MSMYGAFEAFAPPINTYEGLRDAEAAFDLLPIKSLPSFLYPTRTRKRCRQPPVFHFGYPMTYEWAKSYAKKKGLIVYMDTSLGWDKETVDLPATLANITRYINEQTGVTSITVRDAVLTPDRSLPTRKKAYWIISLASNYLGSRPVIPEKEDVDTIQKFLGMPKGPMWHLDADEPVWAVRNIHRR